MTLKAIEMQVALPRTFDAGKLAEQVQQKGQIAQSAIADEAIKKQERERKSVTKKDQMEKSMNSLESNSTPNVIKTGKQTVSAQQQANPLSAHPYKGKSVDYSG